MTISTLNTHSIPLYPTEEVTGPVAFFVKSPLKHIICFSTDINAAVIDGAEAFHCDVKYVVSCERAPQFDKYVEQGFITAKALIEEHNWDKTCGWCKHTVNTETADRTYGDEPTVVYCKPECLERDQRRIAKCAELIQITHDRFANITDVVVESWGEEQVSFKYPGGLGRAKWNVGARVLEGAGGDREALQAYMEANDALKALTDKDQPCRQHCGSECTEIKA